MIRTIYRATDGTEHASRAAAQRYERAQELIEWLAEWGFGAYDRQKLAIELGRRWYLLDRQATRKRGKPHFTGKACMLCGGQVELIAGMEVCVACRPEDATALREKEVEHGLA